MKIWLHRISHHAETAYPLLKKGYLSIGFVDFTSSEFIKETEKEKGSWTYFDKKIKEKWNSTPRTRYNLWRFIHDMKKGDWVVVPSSGKFSIYELNENSAKPINDVDVKNIKTWSKDDVFLKNERLYKGSNENCSLIDLGFFRDVTLIERDIPRNKYADSLLTSRMKFRATNNDMSDLKDSVEKALSAYRENRPINLYSTIMDSYKEQTLSLIHAELNPDKFEFLLKWYFERIGASSVHIPPKNERDKKGDSDIVAVFESIKTIIYVQAKFHRLETSDWAAKQILEYKNNKDSMDDGYSKIGWVVSTSDRFSQKCIDLAKENKIALFNGLEIVEMFISAGFEGLDKAL